MRFCACEELTVCQDQVVKSSLSEEREAASQDNRIQSHSLNSCNEAKQQEKPQFHRGEPRRIQVSRADQKITENMSTRNFRPRIVGQVQMAIERDGRREREKERERDVVPTHGNI